MLRRAIKLVTSSFHRLSLIPLGIFLILAQTFFYINGEAIFKENWNPVWENLILIYIVLTIAFIVFSARQPKPIKTTIPIFVINFVLGFVITWIILLALLRIGIIKVTSPALVGAFIPTLIFHCLIVAPSEEIIFRGVLFPTVGIIPSSFAFAFFHLAVYSGGVLSIAIIIPFVIAFLVGIIYCFITKQYGIGMAIGSHSAWNGVMTGILAKI